MIFAMIKKEFRQILRDRRTLAVLIFIPVFLLVMFGYAISLDVEHAPLAVLDYDQSRRSRRLIDSFARTEYFDLRFHIDSPRQIDRLLAREAARIAIVIPQDFSASILAGTPAEVQAVIDGSNSTTGAAILGYARSIVTQFALQEARSAGAAAEAGRMGSAASRLVLKPRVWFNPELESNVFLIPGLLAFILVVTAVVSTALSLVREKELGTMEQLVASPLRPVDIVVGKTVPYMVLSIVVATFVFVASRLLFHIEITGSPLLLALTTLVFLAACLALGIMISTVSDSQQVAFLLSTLSTLLPSFLLSGFVFPIENMPGIIQAVTYLVPARYYLSALRAVMVRGSGLAGFWPDLLLLVVFTAVMMMASMARLGRTRRTV